jgi:hypothetical protein
MAERALGAAPGLGGRLEVRARERNLSKRFFSRFFWRLDIPDPLEAPLHLVEPIRERYSGVLSSGALAGMAARSSERARSTARAVSTDFMRAA